MSMRVSKDPYGYKKLLVYMKAEELQKACSLFTSHFPLFSRSAHSKTLSALADQMDRSARSIKQNAVEGWKRNSTKEYYDFLGFSMGANAELEEDCDDIIKGIYEKMGLKGEMGERGEGERWDIERVEKLPFYPPNPHLPLLIQLKLRCKELNFLLTKLQKSLADKMAAENRTPLVDRLNSGVQREKANDEWIRKEREKWEKREEGEKRV